MVWALVENDASFWWNTVNVVWKETESSYEG